MLTNQTILQTHQSNTMNPTNLCPEIDHNLTSFAIKSTNVLLDEFDEPIEAIILIQNKKIFDIIIPHQTNQEKLDKLNNEWEIRDYGSLFIFPGLIDSNVHLHANFGTEWENITYSTELAAAGGVTTIVDNPIMTKPYTSGEEYIKSLNQRIRIIKANSKVDFGIYGILEPRTEQFLSQIMEIGALGMKCYLMNCFQNTVGHYAPEHFGRLLQVIEQKCPGLLLVVHPEMATERELYLSSPCRKDPLEKRLDVNFHIKSLEFGGAAHKGSYVEDFSKKTGSGSDEEGDHAEFGNSSPSHYREMIKQNKEREDIEYIVNFDLKTYAYHDQKEDSDASGSDGEFNYVENANQGKNKSLLTPLLNEEKKESEQKVNIEEKKESLLKLNKVKSMTEPSFEEGILSLKELQTKSLMDESLEEIKELKREESYNPKPDFLEEDIPTDSQEEYSKESKDLSRKCSTPLASQNNYTIALNENNENHNTMEKCEETKESSENDQSRKIELFGRSRRRVEVEDEESEEENDKVEIRKPFGRQRALGYDSTDSEDFLPKNGYNRARFSTISSLKDQRSTCDLSESVSKETTKEGTEDLNEKEDGQRMGFYRSNRKFLSLAQSSEDHMHTSISPTHENNTHEGKNSKAPFLKMNLSLDQNSLVLEGSPKMNTRSLNASPMYSGRIRTPASSLLIRRISRNSFVQPSTSSTLSSPVNNKLNLLSLSNTQKNSNKDEKKYNQKYQIFLANRPQSWEENAVSTILNNVTKEMKTRIVLQNLSLASSLDKMAQKRENNKDFGSKIVADCAPAYIYFTDKMVKKGETKYKVSPPFHNKVNRQVLIDFLRLGLIDTLSSYHFYVPPRYKLIDDGNFRRAFGGLDSIGCSLQAAWTASYNFQQKNNKKFNEDLTEKKKIVNQIFRQLYLTMCVNPAQRLNIGDRKGKIAKGRDADLVIWDPYSEDSQQLNPNHIFSGKALLGKVYQTYLRGNVIYNKEDNEEVNKVYTAEFIRA